MRRDNRLGKVEHRPPAECSKYPAALSAASTRHRSKIPRSEQKTTQVRLYGTSVNSPSPGTSRQANTLGFAYLCLHSQRARDSDYLTFTQRSREQVSRPWKQV